MVVQNAAKAITGQELLSGPGKQSPPVQKETGEKFDQLMKDRLEQEEALAKDVNDRQQNLQEDKDTPETDQLPAVEVPEGKDAALDEEAAVPQEVLQWLAMVMGTKAADVNAVYANVQNPVSKNQEPAAVAATDTIVTESADPTANEAQKEMNSQFPATESKKSSETSSQIPATQSVAVGDSDTAVVNHPADMQINTATQKDIPGMAETEPAVKEAMAANLAGEDKEKGKTAGISQEQTPAVEGQLVQTDRPQTMHSDVPKADRMDPRPVPIADTNQAEQIGEAVAKQLAGGRQEFEIQLEPLHLGKLLVKVAYEAGKAAVSIVCSESKTMQMMSQNAKELGSILENHMGTQTQVIVEKEKPADYLQQEQQQGKNKQNQEANEQQRRSEKDGDDADSLNFLQQLRLGLV